MYEQARPLAAFALRCVASWESPACHHHLASYYILRIMIMNVLDTVQHLQEGYG